MRRLRANTHGLVAVGVFDTNDHFGSVAIDKTFFYYPVERDGEGGLSPLAVASAGVFRYLEGYDPQESSTLAERIEESIGT